jgi:hypothetical protein
VVAVLLRRSLRWCAYRSYSAVHRAAADTALKPKARNGFAVRALDPARKDGACRAPGQKVTVEGWRDGVLQYTSTVWASNQERAHYDFGFNTIDRVVFRSNEGLELCCNHIVLDNISYSVPAVPDPSTWLLMGLGTLALLTRGRFRPDRGRHTALQ